MCGHFEPSTTADRFPSKELVRSVVVGCTTSLVTMHWSATRRRYNPIDCPIGGNFEQFPFAVQMYFFSDIRTYKNNPVQLEDYTRDSKYIKPNNKFFL